MKQATFNKEIELFKKEVIEITGKIFNSEKEIRPVLFNFLYKKGFEKQPMGVIAGFDQFLTDNESKKKVSYSLKKMVEEIKPIAVAFISEGYALEGSQENYDKVKEYLKTNTISNHPERQEIVLITIETSDLESLVTFLIERNGDNAKLVLKESVDWQPKNKNSGVLQNFLTECYIEIEDDEDANLSSF